MVDTRTAARLLRRHSNAEAARLMGVSRERARQLRAQLEIPTPVAGEDRRKRVITMLTAGIAATEVARQVGLSVSQVRRIGRAAAVPRRPTPARCGSRAGYMRHLRAGEPACVLCLEANRKETADRRAQR